MVRKYVLTVQFLLIATLGLVAPRGAVAQPKTTSNIILVHGAWADGSSWSRVIPLLEARGLNVTAVQLPLTSLADDVATTRRAIAQRDRTIPPDLEETMAATIGARTTTLNTCHLAMLDLPSQVADVIADAARGK